LQNLLKPPLTVKATAKRRPDKALTSTCSMGMSVSPTSSDGTVAEASALQPAAQPDPRPLRAIRRRTHRRSAHRRTRAGRAGCSKARSCHADCMPARLPARQLVALPVLPKAGEQNGPRFEGVRSRYEIGLRRRPAQASDVVHRQWRDDPSANGASARAHQRAILSKNTTSEHAQAMRGQTGGT
jgi:hypothetical protein